MRIIHSIKYQVNRPGFCVTAATANLLVNDIQCWKDYLKKGNSKQIEKLYFTTKYFILQNDLLNYKKIPLSP
jgi:hypothetical protein